MKIKASDYIVEFFISKEIKDVFGYPGGMVTHLMNSLSKYSNSISTHINYHEQASSFAACGYAQAVGTPSVVFATSGPGATNLITGIANAYFDSIPVIFITGQVNTTENKSDFLVRQRGFQETDVITIVKTITKEALYVDNVDNLPDILEQVYNSSMEGRKGPVLLDIPMNIQREYLETDNISSQKIFNKKPIENTDQLNEILNLIRKSKRPCIIIGAGAKSEYAKSSLNQFISNTNMPVVTSMLAIDVLASDCDCNFGFLGAYGARCANFIVAKADLIVSIGSRLDIRQVGSNREDFAPNAKLVRVDIDEKEFSYKVKNNELQICLSSEETLDFFTKNIGEYKVDIEWIKKCMKMRNKLQLDHISIPENYIRKISSFVGDNTIITTDVGQNQVWIAQYYDVKCNDKVLFSGGHGAMGYSLPAAIGAYYASKSKVICFTGDGGMQMNIQELAFIAKEQLPIVIIVINNNALGMIRHFQEVFFDNNYAFTVPNGGYSSPDFANIAKAYDIRSFKVNEIREIKQEWFCYKEPILIEIFIDEKTYICPRLKFGHPNHDQEPLIPRAVFEQLMNL